jgi:lysyl-tRNA synthetase class 2
MKRLLAAGYPRIFQICRCFRQGERGDRHLPEFTMLEWYRAGTDYRTLMTDCEDLLAGIARDLDFDGVLGWRGRAIDLAPPWERLTVREAFLRYATLSADEALRQDRFDEVLSFEVEPHLGLAHPVFLCDYPAELAALARLKPEKPGVAERFELYLAGIELANAFSELTDAEEQRRRFASVSRERLLQGGAPGPMPEKFLAALPQMPPAAGIALGVDRLAMLMSGASRIDEVVAFTPETL